MQRWFMRLLRALKTSFVFQLYPAVLSATALLCIINLFRIPSDPKNSLFLGLSPARLLMVATFFILATSSGFLFCLFLRNKTLSGRVSGWLESGNNARSSLLLAFLFLLITWSLFFTPPSYLDIFEWYPAVKERFNPLLVWLLVAEVGFIVSVVVFHNKTRQNFLSAFVKSKSAIRAGLTPYFTFLAAWGFIALTGLGVHKEEYWHTGGEAGQLWGNIGVPLLNWQVFFAILMGLILVAILGKLDQILFKDSPQPQKRLWLAAVCFLGIWGLAAILWNVSPASENNFTRHPSSPNYALYPNMDARTYDIYTHEALIGIEYRHGLRVDKPLLLYGLFILNLLAGSNFNLLLCLNTTILALLTPLLYLLASRLFGKFPAWLITLLGIFKGMNSLSQTIPPTPHQKNLLSEWPLLVLLVLFTYFMVKWIQHPQNRGSLISAAGVLGFSVMMRHNAWLILPLVFLAILWVYKQDLKTFLQRSFLFGCIFLAALTPWAIYSVSLGNVPFTILDPIRTAIWGNRYLPIVNEPAETSTPQPETPTATETKTSRNILVEMTTSRFLYNLISTSMTMPLLFDFESLPNTISHTPPYNFWDVLKWDGKIPLPSAFLMLTNLALIALGIGFARKHQGLAGIFPLLLYIFYTLSICLAQTAGGRYIIPIDWVVFFYYAAGLAQVIQWLGALIKPGMPILEMTPSPDDQISLTQPVSPIRQWLPVAIVACVAVSMPLTAKIVPTRYPPASEKELAAGLVNDAPSTLTGIEASTLEEFLYDENAVILEGRALYPIFTKVNTGAENGIEIPQISFILAGPVLFQQVKLPTGNVNPGFQHAADVRVVGCRVDKRTIDAYLVIVKNPDKSQVIYHRQPDTSLNCPLTQPKCDGNGNCWD